MVFIETQGIFDNGKSSYREELEKIYSKDPDVIFWEASPPEAKVILKEKNEMNLGGVWIGTDYVNADFVEEVAAFTDIEGIIGIAPAPAPGPRLEKWKYDLNKLTGVDVSTVPAFSAQGYDAMNLIALAIEAAGEPARDAIKANVRKIANAPGIKVYNFAEGAQYLREGKDIDYIGIAGKVEFNEYGDVMVDYIVSQIKSGKITQIGVLSQEELEQYAQ